MKIRSFTDLEAWKVGHIVVLDVYKNTLSFPKEEKFGLTSQIRRSAVSITSNIAEGFSRRSRKEKAQFLYMALGLTTELQDQLLIARDLRYINNILFNKLADQTMMVHKLINGLIKSSKRLTT